MNKIIEYLCNSGCIANLCDNLDDDDVYSINICNKTLNKITKPIIFKLSKKYVWISTYAVYCDYGLCLNTIGSFKNINKCLLKLFSALIKDELICVSSTFNKKFDINKYNKTKLDIINLKGYAFEKIDQFDLIIKKYHNEAPDTCWKYSISLFKIK